MNTLIKPWKKVTSFNTNFFYIILFRQNLFKPFRKKRKEKKRKRLFSSLEIVWSKEINKV